MARNLLLASLAALHLGNAAAAFSGTALAAARVQQRRREVVSVANVERKDIEEALECVVVAESEAELAECGTSLNDVFELMSYASRMKRVDARKQADTTPVPQASEVAVTAPEPAQAVTSTPDETRVQEESTTVEEAKNAVESGTEEVVTPKRRARVLGVLRRVPGVLRRVLGAPVRLVRRRPATKGEMSVEQCCTFMYANPSEPIEAKSAFLKSKGVSEFVIAQATCCSELDRFGPVQG